MKLPPFTLIHRGREGSRKSADDLRIKQLALISQVNPKFAESLDSLKASIRSTLLDSMLPKVTNDEQADFKIPVMLERAITELKRRPKVITVGIWDVGARVGRLPAIVEHLNNAQTLFAFFEIQAAIPAGMVSRPERVAAWAEEQLGKPLTVAQRKDLTNNIIADNFFARAERVRKDLGIDYLAGITPSMIAGSDDEEVYWNHFSSSWGRLILASTRDLRSFASEAGRPFEAAVAGLIVSSLLVVTNPRLGFHEDTGCLFDYNEDRKSIIHALKRPLIEPSCLSLITPQYRESAEAFVTVLKTYQEGGVT